MVIQIRTTNLLLAPALEVRLREQFSQALSRFSPHVREVVVRVTDVNGPRGGVDKLCRAILTLDGGGVLVAEGRGESVGQAAAVAARRCQAQIRRWSAKRRRSWQQPARLLASI